MDNEFVFPKTQAVIDKLNNQPTTEDRLMALENAMVEMALNQMGVE